MPRKWLALCLTGPSWLQAALLPISKIESATTLPEQCLNMHFYFPVMETTMVDFMDIDRERMVSKTGMGLELFSMRRILHIWQNHV